MEPIIIKDHSLKDLIKITTRIGKKDTDLIVSSKYQIWFKRDNFLFNSKTISIFQLSGFMLASLSGMLNRNNILSDRYALFKNKETLEESKATIKIYKGVSSTNNKFKLSHYPIKIRCYVNDNSELFIKYKLSTINIINFLGQISKIKYPLFFYSIKEMNIIRNNDTIEIKIGGSESVYLNNKNLKIFLYSLERWLSGQYLLDEKKIKSENTHKTKQENKAYYTTRFNREGLGFNGMPIPMLNIHGVSCKFTYSEIAEMYYVLKAMNNYNKIINK